MAPFFFSFRSNLLILGFSGHHGYMVLVSDNSIIWSLFVSVIASLF